MQYILAEFQSVYSMLKYFHVIEQFGQELSKSIKGEIKKNKEKGFSVPDADAEDALPGEEPSAAVLKQ